MHCIGIGTSGTQGAHAPYPNIGKDSTDIDCPTNSHSCLSMLMDCIHINT